VSVQKTGLNVTQGDTTPTERMIATSGQTVQFVIRVNSVATQSVNNVVVRDTVPAGMTYQTGSTYVDGVRTSSDEIVSTGLLIGILPAGTSFTVRWSAQVNPTNSSLPEQQPAAFVSADGISLISDGVTLDILGPGSSLVIGNGGTPTPGGVGGVQTGPGDAVTLALLVSVGVTLLYTAYTRSPEFRNKEVEKISHDQYPLDFRG